jgi:hypothetical protein
MMTRAEQAATWPQIADWYDRLLRQGKRAA